MNTAVTSSAYSPSGQQLIAAVEQYIDVQGWRKEKVAYEDGHLGFRMSFRMQHASYRTFFDLLPDQGRFAVYSYCPVEIPEEARGLVAEFIARANYRLYHGKLEIHMDEGTVRYCCTVSVEGSCLSQEMISLMENAAICGMDDHFPALMVIVHGGKGAREVFERLLIDAEQSADSDEVFGTLH